MTTTAKETTVARSELAKVLLSEIHINEDLNVRKTYNDPHIKELAISIAKVGISRPLTVAKSENGYTLLGGFCRVRAVQFIYPDTWQSVVVPVSVVVAKTPEELMQFNLGDDESAEQPKRSEVADRLFYMVEEVGIKQSKLAEKTGISQADISKMVSIMRKLHPDVIEQWKLAPSRDTEIPFALLYNWSQYKPEQQLEALAHYRSPPLIEGQEDQDEQDEQQPEEAEEEGKPKKRAAKEILHKVRTKKEIKDELGKYLELEELTEGQQAVRKALEWCLSERKTIRL